MPRISKSAFVFKPEFGARLRDLRKRRKLSLRALALLMDRPGAGYCNLIARLERGDVKSPSFSVVADFLRACGARTSDVADLLDAYLAQPPVPRQKGDAAVAELLKSLPKPQQRAMLAWERATADVREAKAAAEPEKKKPRVETDRQRVFRIIWSFIHANWNEEFEGRLYVAMLKVKSQVPRSRRKDACRHGRRMFGVLTRYYKTEKRKQSTLALVQRRAKEDGFSDEVVSGLLQAATEAYTELARTGRLDWQPTQEQIIRASGRAPKVEKAETRLEMDEVAPVTEFNKSIGLVHAMVMSAVTARLDELRLDHHTVKQHYYNWLAYLVPIAVEHGTDSDEWRAQVEAWVPRLHDPTVAREAADIAARTFNIWKVRLRPVPTEAV